MYLLKFIFKWETFIIRALQKRELAIAKKIKKNLFAIHE